MNKAKLFESLETYDLPALLKLLSAAYDALGHDERQDVFGSFVKTQPPARVDGEKLLDEIEGFQRRER